MDHHGENTPTFFTRLAYGLVWKRRPAIRQTSLIFQLPDELILFIPSSIFPEPRPSSSYARFCVQYCMEIDDDHQRRMEFLQSLSMTCRTMRSRLLPWMWGLIQPSRRFGTDLVLWNFAATTHVLHLDKSLATIVRFMTVHYLEDQVVQPFVRCLSSLPNLHTLKLGSSGGGPDTTLLETALGQIRLPRIKTLIIPEPAHPLLKHCPNVEDVVWVITDKPIHSDEFLRSLTSNCDSKVERLTIPLGLPCNPSRYVAACPRLTELTVLYPHPYQHLHPFGTLIEMGTLLGTTRTARSALLELMNACDALPNFGTFQIVHLSLTTPPPMRKYQWYRGLGPYTEQEEQVLREQIQDMKDRAINRFTRPEAGCQEGGGREKAALRFIELNPALADTNVGIPPVFHLGSMKVEEYGV